MKIKNKIIALMISLIAMPTFALAKDGPYLGIKASNLKLNYDTIDGVDLNEIYDKKIRAYDYHIGYNTGSWFGEFAYLKSETGNRNIVSVTSGIYTFTADTKIDFDGFRLGGGYNFKPSKELSIKPFANIYRLDTNAKLTGTITDGEDTYSEDLWKISGKETMIDAGLGIGYSFSENVSLEASYSRSFKEIEDVDKIEMLSISLKYNF